ncbi:MAG: hypothetical protein B7X99_12125 [Rhizobiales bacterium 17-65-6]|nr:MAG: hypothetical protein B7Z30_00635 [Rhizobiales bacterium 12-68-15]OYZ98248.1 MAG: hypothetical protein B7X99_12125 [Rhizobiales bacterium 17-65-6]
MRARERDQAVMMADIWQEHAEAWRRRAEMKGTDSLTDLHLTVLRHLGPDEELQRIEMMQCMAYPVSQDARDRCFLGMNLYDWILLPDEVTSLFGLRECVLDWRRQVGEVGWWPPTLSNLPTPSDRIH